MTCLLEKKNRCRQKRFCFDNVQNAKDGIRTRASEEIGALNRRLRPTRPPPLVAATAEKRVQSSHPNPPTLLECTFSQYTMPPIIQDSLARKVLQATSKHPASATRCELCALTICKRHDHDFFGLMLTEHSRVVMPRIERDSRSSPIKES